MKFITCLYLLAFSFVPLLFTGQVMGISQIGSKIPINVQTSGDQRNMGNADETATLSNGNFVITWESKNGAEERKCYFRIFKPDWTPLTDEMLIYTTTSDVESPFVQAIDAGHFAITFAVGSGYPTEIYYNEYSNDGVATGNAVQVTTSQSFGTYKNLPIPTSFGPGTGYFLITWFAYSDATHYEVLGRVYRPGRIPVTNEFRINSESPNRNAGYVVFAIEGRAYVIWEDWGDYHQRFRSVSSNGALGPVHDYTQGMPAYIGDACVIMDGNIAASRQAISEPRKMYVTILRPDGTILSPASPQLIVDRNVMNRQMVHLGDNRIAVAWSEFDSSGTTYDVFFRVFLVKSDYTVVSLSDIIPVATGVGDHDRPSPIVMLAEKKMAIVTREKVDGVTVGYDVFARIYDIADAKTLLKVQHKTVKILQTFKTSYKSTK